MIHLSCPHARGTQMNVRYRVELSQAERDQLDEMLRGGKHAARRLKRAQILLAADNGVTDAVIAATVGVGASTVYRTKRRLLDPRTAGLSKLATCVASAMRARIDRIAIRMLKPSISRRNAAPASRARTRPGVRMHRRNPSSSNSTDAATP